MEDKDNGGWAFPATDAEGFIFTGMTLRAYIATEMLSTAYRSVWEVTGGRGTAERTNLVALAASVAVAMADALIAELRK